MITGDMIVDYEMANPDEFLEFYQEMKYPNYSDLEAKVKRDDKNDN